MRAKSEKIIYELDRFDIGSDKVYELDSTDILADTIK